MTSDGLDAIFVSANRVLDGQAIDREEVLNLAKHLSLHSRIASGALQSIHQHCDSRDSVVRIAQSTLTQARESCEPLWRKLEMLLNAPSVAAADSSFAVDAAANNESSSLHDVSGTSPSGRFERHHDALRYALQGLISAAVMCHFLSTGTLLPPYQCASFLGTCLPIDIEDYLFAVCSLPAELARYCRNLMRVGAMEAVPSVAAFVHDLSSGFRFLTLRNDALRRKVDSIKYDVLKIEEILYDVALHSKKLT